MTWWIDLLIHKTIDEFLLLWEAHEWNRNECHCVFSFCENIMFLQCNCWIVVASFWGCPKSFNNLHNQIAWHVVVVSKMYSASTDDIETIGCFLDIHKIIFLPRKNTSWGVFYFLDAASKISVCIPSKNIVCWRCIPQTMISGTYNIF